MKRRRLAIVAAVAAALVLSGCTSNDGIAGQYKAGDNKGYVTDQQSTFFKPDGRGKTVSFTTKTDAGAVIDSKDYLGKVVVLNFWYASCPPCRLEAPDLEKVSQQYANQGVQFLGVNTRDQATTSSEFSKKFGMSYPSVVDANDGNVIYALAGVVAPNAVPTTIVLDRKGRVAARILGKLESQAELEGYVDAALEDS